MADYFEEMMMELEQHNYHVMWYYFYADLPVVEDEGTEDQDFYYLE